jgi:CelD/BcsL family acetyltransferase involved in cellulose biosynthesis
VTNLMLTDLWQPTPAFSDTASAEPSRAEPVEVPVEPWAVERISDRGAFEALRPEWDELLEASPSNCLFLTWEWLFTWWKHLGGDRRLALLAVRLGSQLVALAPFARGTSRPAGPLGRLLLPTSLQLLGTGQVGSDYLDLLVRAGREHPAAEALAEHLAEEGSVMELRQLPAQGSLAHTLAESLTERGWKVAERGTNVCPVIDLAGLSWEDYVASLGKSHRQNLRRRLRKLEETFDVRFERAGSEIEVDEAFQILLDLHRKRWRGRGGSDALSDPRVVAFHREVTRLALRRGWLRLYVLRLDGRPAAALYGFLYRDRFLYYQSGFDGEFGDYSVGLAIMGLAIREAIAEGAREYDLLHGDESYKFLWASRSRELARLELYPPSLDGHLRRHARGALRGVKARLRAWRGGEER